MAHLLTAIVFSRIILVNFQRALVCVIFTNSESYLDETDETVYLPTN